MTVQIGTNTTSTTLAVVPLAYRAAIADSLATPILGPKMQFLEEGFNLPLTFASGISYQLLKSFLVSADIKHQLYDSKTTFAVGTEFSPLASFSLRAGYLTNMTDNGLRITNNSQFAIRHSSFFSGLGLGVGFKLGNSNIDYSFTPASELGNTQRISLTIGF